MSEENVQNPEEKAGLGKKIEEAAALRDAEEFLRGRKQVRVIKKSAIKEIIDALIAEYGGVEQKDLLSKMAEYELKLADLQQEREVLLPLAEKGRSAEPHMKELEERVDNLRGEYGKREEELKRKVKGLEEIIAGDQLRKRLEELEYQLAAQRSRIEELMCGLEYVAAVEEFDYGEAIFAAEEQSARIAEVETALSSAQQDRLTAEVAGILPEIRKRNGMFREAFRRHSASHAELTEKIANNEGSIDVVVELVRMSVKSKWYRQELKVFDTILDYAQVLAGK